ncbi:sensor histidine kinase [Novosphingobium sp. JCM 18896]|uniref:sensor histidine kinase n=1 Tax=Novosphingobium sp. JCM 18896 TaxID=2989731 RepID=UPI0022233A3C|nr:ATP-binding protein [Novosphingobium sp. JCM 18896]MCW1431772.1 ATP-binding protein [Novosphingobium sp. JCM 18896]
MRGDARGQRLVIHLRMAGAAVVALAIFALDVLSPLQGAVAVLYTTVVLLSARTGQRDLVIATGTVGAGLAVLAYLISHSAEPLGSPAMRLTVSLVANAITTFLSIRHLAEIDQRRHTQARLDQAQAELAHVSRLNLLGQMGASIAHEINQPLSAIVTYAKSGQRWLGRAEPDAAEAADCLDHIAANAARAADIIGRIRDIARRAEPRQDHFALAGLVAETIALLQRDLQSHEVVVRTAIAPDLPMLGGDRVQIQQVLMNLMLNADQAMTQTPANRRELQLEASRDGDEVIVTVSDRGTGLPPDTEPLFEPFRSTKPDGMGMGLSISRAIIERHAGRLTSANRADGGASFRFTLPIAPPSIAPGAKA